MTDRDVLIWIRRELGETIRQALAVAKCDFKYTEEILAAIACRETKNIIAEHAGKLPMLTISSITRGDFSQRRTDKEKVYHGYSFWQIDIDSYPDFVRSGAWKDPLKACVKAIEVLEEKRRYIQVKLPHLAGDDLLRAILAAYNCGQGNVVKVLQAGEDVDSRTSSKDYSQNVLRYAQEFARLSR